jgi:hypothetical protein
MREAKNALDIQKKVKISTVQTIKIVSEYQFMLHYKETKDNNVQTN